MEEVEEKEEKEKEGGSCPWNHIRKQRNLIILKN